MRIGIERGVEVRPESFAGDEVGNPNCTPLKYCVLASMVAAM
jgi:hypothetical protein